MRARPAITSSALAIVFLCAIASASELSDRLATDDPRALAAAINEVERAPSTTPDLADLLYTAGRACEDKLADPARALALYDRLLREQPETKAALGADHRAAHLRALTGDGHAAEARTFAKLVADAPTLAPALVIARGELLTANWPGAAEATLWLAEWLRAHGELARADAHYTLLLATWPTAPQARLAASGQAGAAIDAHAFDRARTLIAALPRSTDEDRAVQADLQRSLHRGLVREELDVIARIAIVLVVALLLGSLADAAFRGGWRRPSLKPPFEIWFLGPISLVLAAASFTANQAIAPAVLRISIAGVVLAWLSGSTLDLLRTRGRGSVCAPSHISLCARSASSRSPISRSARAACSTSWPRHSRTARSRPLTANVGIQALGKDLRDSSIPVAVIDRASLAINRRACGRPQDLVDAERAREMTKREIAFVVRRTALGASDEHGDRAAYWKTRSIEDRILEVESLRRLWTEITGDPDEPIVRVIHRRKLGEPAIQKP